MIKKVLKETWFVDFEWVPDPSTGRRVYGLDQSLSDGEVVEIMWREGGATEQNPRPYLKTVHCRIVSAAAVFRKANVDGDLKVEILSIPRLDEGAVSENELLGRFFEGLEKHIGRTADATPQIVGFNIRDSDLPILVQRAIVNRIVAPRFNQRPQKSWDGKDYFNKYSDHLIDLRELLAGWNKGGGTLHEFACAFGVPGKIDFNGAAVSELWAAGRVREIVEYNQFDVFTTYLVWLYTVRFAGLIPPDAADLEVMQFRQLLEARSEANPHISRYLSRWDELNSTSTV